MESDRISLAAPSPIEETDAIMRNHEANSQVREALSHINQLLAGNNTINGDDERKEALLELLEKTCEILEKEEEYYISVADDPFNDNRSSFPIGSLLAMCVESEDLLELLTNLCLSSDKELSVAAIRLLLAIEPMSKRSVLVSITDPTLLKKLLEIATSSETPARKYAVGLLGVDCLCRDVADVVVQTNLPEVLIRRLRTGKVILEEIVDGENGRNETIQSLSPPASATVSSISTASEANFVNPPKNNSEEIKSPDSTKDSEFQRVSQEAIEDLEELSDHERMLTLQCLGSIGDYQEVVVPVFKEEGTGALVEILKKGTKHLQQLFHALRWTCGLLAHKKWALEFIELGGVELLVNLTKMPDGDYINGAVALCFYGMSSISGVAEKMCKLPETLLDEVMNASIYMLTSHSTNTRKNVCLFLSTGLACRAFLDRFDAKNGLSALLNLLRQPNPSTSGVTGRAGYASKIVTHHACLTLRQYFRMHASLLAHKLWKRAKIVEKGPHKVRSIPPYHPMELDNETIESTLAVLERYRSAGLEFFCRLRWAPVEELLLYQGISLLLSITNWSLVSRYTEVAQFALHILRIATLLPHTITTVCCEEVEVAGPCGIDILLEVAYGNHKDSEAMIQSLYVLCNCLCAVGKHGPSTIAHQTSTQSLTCSQTSQETQNTQLGLASLDGQPQNQELNTFHNSRLVASSSNNHDGVVLSQFECLQRNIRRFTRSKNGIRVILFYFSVINHALMNLCYSNNAIKLYYYFVDQFILLF